MADDTGSVITTMSHRQDDEDAGSIALFIDKTADCENETEAEAEAEAEADDPRAFLAEAASLIVEGKRNRRKPKTAEDRLSESRATIAEMESNIQDAKNEIAEARA